MKFTHEYETLAHALDTLSVATLLGWIMGYLPAIATALTIIWTGLRCYESWLSIQEKRGKKSRGA